MNKNWILKDKAPQKFVSQNSEYPEFLLHLLWSRNIKTKEEIKDFLNPDYEEDLHNPFLLKDIKKASDRIWRAVEKREKIMIYGDYDADGITASAILANFFKEFKIDHGVYMPDRSKEGHGLNIEAVDGFIKDGVDLLITLDCGMVNKKEIEVAQEKGVDVIVVDHHQEIGEKPGACAIVNPHQKGATYPFKGLCGAGLSFKLFQVLVRDERAKNRWSKDDEKWMLDLVAIGTVADMMPLIDENRTLVKYGLLVLAQTKRPGLKELFKVAGVKPSLNREDMKTNIDSLTIGFSLGPRINAASRMAHAALGYDLLMAENPIKARSLALELEENNRKRKKEIGYVFKDVVSRIDKENPPSFIVESSPSWSITILGLIANRVKDRFFRPIMLIEEQDDVAKASFRAPKRFDLIKSLDYISDLLIQYGGHKAAAGASLEIEKIPLIKERLNQYADKNLTEEMKLPKIEIDSEINLSDLSLQNAEIVEKISPFGMANPQPVFIVKRAELDGIKMLGKEEKHAKLFFKSGRGGSIPALMFFHNGEVDKLETGKNYDLIGELSVNEWNGAREAQFKIIDILSNFPKKE